MNRLSGLLVMTLVFGCGPAPTPDAGGMDAGGMDAGGVDAGGMDAGGMDAGPGNTVTLRYHRALNDYAGWTVAVSQGATPATASSTGTDGWGAVYTLTLAPGAQAITFSLRNGAASDPAGTLTASLASGAREIWVLSGLDKAITRRPLAVPGPNQVALYYQRPDNSYSGWGLHLWGELVTETQWVAPLQPVGTDPDLGSAFVVPLTTGVRGNCQAGRICLIMHKGDEKDPGPDMAWDRTTVGDIAFLTSGSATLSSAPRKPGLVELSGAAAHLVSRNQVAWEVPDGGASVELRYSPTGSITFSEAGVDGGTAIPLTPRTGGLSGELKALAPHLSAWPAFDVPSGRVAEVSQAVKGQLVAVARKADGSLLAATRVQTAFALDDLFFTAEPLGPTFASPGPSAPRVAVWAPTAQTVRLRVYNADASKTEVAGSPFTMTANDKGVWSVTGMTDWYGKYYRFELVLYHPTSERVETLLTTDPWATSLSTNSRYAQFIDLKDPATIPAGFEVLQKPALAGLQDVVLYEGHVRDFSITDSTVPAEQRGKYLAFTSTTSDGMRYLATLADAGMTHLHLLPAFDIATVDEDPANRVELTSRVSDACAKAPMMPAMVCSMFATQTVREAMAAQPGNSEVQQAIASAIRQLDGFNWGYDPFHFGVPEGSYASTAEGPARILEFRQMVAGLNRAGLRVVMDVVYNHTNSSGLSNTSVLDKVVPGYYHRLDERSGTVATSTCCANTATEHKMMQRLMVDTLVRFARDYKVDGFRFDLMGHHMKQNILDAKAALNALDPTVDGVDGSKLVLYGEGWDFGEVANNLRGTNATQRNMAGTGVATFNDRMRDGVRGGGPFDNRNDLRKNQGFASGAALAPNELNDGGVAEQETLDKNDNWIRIGMAGNLRGFRVQLNGGTATAGAAYGYGGAPTGYTDSPLEAVQYCSAHDNQTLFDILQYKLPRGLPMDERSRADSVAMATIALGQGMPFFHLGDEWLRSKSMERDSYDSGDWFNRVDWTGATSVWRSGLPNQEKDGANWSLIGTLFGDTSIAPTQADITRSRDRFLELLRLRKSTPLLRLPSGAEVARRVDFPAGGASYSRGLMVMTVTDGTCAGAELDPERDAVVVLINAGPTAATYTLTGASGLTLHPVDAASVDARARTSTFSGGTFTIPGRTSAVFEQRQTGAQGAGLPCNTR